MILFRYWRRPEWDFRLFRQVSRWQGGGNFATGSKAAGASMAEKEQRQERKKIDDVLVWTNNSITCNHDPKKYSFVSKKSFLIRHFTLSILKRW